MVSYTPCTAVARDSQMNSNRKKAVNFDGKAKCCILLHRCLKNDSFSRTSLSSILEDKTYKKDYRNKAQVMLFVKTMAHFSSRCSIKSTKTCNGCVE
jgi:hypothetical protein